jgi:heme/copper-type cytochrome/quinol oxidase subunit 3
MDNKYKTTRKKYHRYLLLTCIAIVFIAMYALNAGDGGIDCFWLLICALFALAFVLLKIIKLEIKIKRAFK